MSCIIAMLYSVVNRPIAIDESHSVSTHAQDCLRMQKLPRLAGYRSLSAAQSRDASGHQVHTIVT